jgi:hypothetical protein
MIRQSSPLTLRGLPQRKVSAVRRRARRLGISEAEYLNDLIEEDLNRERRIRVTPLEVLARPISDALNGLSQAEVIAIVDKARRRKPANGRGH